MKPRTLILLGAAAVAGWYLLQTMSGAKSWTPTTGAGATPPTSHGGLDEDLRPYLTAGSTPAVDFGAPPSALYTWVSGVATGVTTGIGSWFK